MEIRLPAWVDGRYVDMADVLRMVGQNAWAWRLEEFDGLFKREGGDRAREVEERLVRQGSLMLDWPELVSIAEGLHQTIWCRLVAVDPHTPEPVITLDCFDSSSWELVAPDGHPAGTQALRRVTQLWPTAD